MKKVIFLLLTATVLWSCQNATFTIKGTVIDPDFEGTNVYLQERTDDGLQTLDTAVVQNGMFSFTGMANENALRYVSLDEQNRVLVLLERGIINVVFGDVISVSGTKINTAFNEFRLKYNELNRELASIVERVVETQAAGIPISEELLVEVMYGQPRIMGEKRNLALPFIRNNIENEAGKYVLRTSIDLFGLEIQEELIELVDDNLRTYPTIARVVTRLENARNVAVGNRFVDFTLQDPEDNEVSLSDFAGRGNYVLVNFWATWCGPCIQKIPHLVELYAKYKDRGFEIVGVSLDRDHDAWVAGIERLNITWVQMSDMKSWQSPAAQLYVIPMIPHTVLLDREGYIIANSLRGEALSNKLAELMP